MKRFNDANGKQWEFDIDVDSIERVKSICQIDLTSLFGDDLKLIARLFEEPALLISVLWELINHPDQSLKPAFRKAMKGDALELAANLLVNEIIDFFPNAKRRELCREAVRKVWQTVEVNQTQAASLMAQYDPTSSNSATSSPESSASIPAGSPSGS